MKKHSLRAILVRRLVMLVLLPWLVIVPVILLIFMPAGQQQSEEAQRLLADNIQAQARDYLKQAESSLERLALELKQQPSSAARQRLLNSWADASGVFSAVYLLDADARIQLAGLPLAIRTKPADLQGKPFALDTQLAKAWSSGQAAWSAAFASPSSRDFCMARALPFDGQWLLGEVNASTSLQGLTQRLGQDSLVKIFLLDQRDKLVAGPEEMVSLSMQEIGDLPPVLEARQNGESPILDFQLSGVSLTGEASLLSDTGWLMLVAQPASQARLMERQSLLQLLAITLIALLITLPVALLTARTLSQRFRDFIAQMLKIAKGNYGLVLADTQITEIDLLSEHLRLMVNAIKQREVAMVLSADGLRISQERLLATLNLTPNVAVQWYDRSGRILMWNKACESIFGYSSEQALGQTAQQLFYTPEQGSDFLTRLQGLQMGETLGPLESVFQRCDGSSGSMLSTAFCIPGELSEHQFACMAIDITEQKKAKRALQEVNQTLEQRVDERTAALTQSNQELLQAMQTLEHTQDELLASEKLAALGAMVAGIAHELNTPIGNSLMAATTLKDHSVSFAADLQAGSLRRSSLERFIEQNQTATDILIRNLFRASELIISFKQVAVDQTSEQKRSFRLLDLVNEILLTLHPTLKKTPFTVEVDVPESILLDSYPGPLGQALVNLITNAITHAFDGYSQGCMRINAKALDAQWIELAFSDNGAGIPPENLKRIFDPFFTTRLGQGGSGLGLNVTHNVVCGILGGSLNVSSQLGEGTRFVLRLPRTAPR